MLSDEDVNRIAEAVVEKAAEDVGVRDIMIGSMMGKGAIPLYGRETRKEPCACCLIDPAGPNAPENRMCTTKGAIGTLNDREEREWCSEISIVPDGRCARARSIREAARECKEKYPEDTAKFFECYAPAFSQITRGSNPGDGPIVSSLLTSINEEEQAVRDCTRRATEASQSSDEKTGRLFEHIATEEETHAGEIRKRAGELIEEV